ncbi:condensation domain-containing protein [Streptomyces sp. NPDC002138]|uniref:condensation domain-containing protein n=1 Tax=Streptomyces sp. NPDC002138 TaxID=3154410 RepID=UPI00331F4D77
MTGASGPRGPGPVVVVVREAGRPAAGSPLVLGVRGLRDDADAELFAARIAGRHRQFQVTLECHGPGRHTLRLMPGADARAGVGADGGVGEGVGGGDGDGGVLGAELLADLLGPRPGAGEPLALTGHQRDLLWDAVTRQSGPDRHIEQLHWNWAGPLERARFAAAWQSVADREAVLRAAFDWTAVDRLVLHPRADVDIVHHAHGGTGWPELLAADLAHGFALDRPPLLRLTLLDGRPGQPVRVLLTYHRALLDERGVHLLLREFYRAYLAGGVLPGGERRPDLRDHARWLARQSGEGARELWTRTGPPRHAATAVGRRGADTRQSGAGRLRGRLVEPYSSGLRSWAAARGAGESSALHVVWALLLYRAAGTGGPLRVSFGVQLGPRDIALPGAAGIPGVLGHPLPMTVRVDPAAPLAELLQQVRDALLDLAAYPWVSGDRIRTWLGRGEGERLTDTVVSFDHRPELPPEVRAELEGQGIEVDEPRAVGGGAGLPITPITLNARHERGGALALSAVYDRASLADEDASAALGQCVSLLRALARMPEADPGTTVGQALALLAHVEVPSVAARPPLVRRVGLRTLRVGAPSADVICLVGVPGVVAGAYELFARRHRGVERVVVLWVPDSGVGVGGLGAGVGVGELDGVLVPGRRVFLCGCGPGAGAAQALADAVVRDAGRGVAVTVLMTGVAGAEATADALARALASVPAPMR